MRDMRQSRDQIFFNAELIRSPSNIALVLLVNNRPPFADLVRHIEANRRKPSTHVRDLRSAIVPNLMTLLVDIHGAGTLVVLDVIDPRVIPGFAGSPSGKQVFIVNEEAAIAENGRRTLELE
jgi:hypothetical protein